MHLFYCRHVKIRGLKLMFMVLSFHGDTLHCLGLKCFLFSIINRGIHIYGITFAVPYKFNPVNLSMFTLVINNTCEEILYSVFQL